MESFVSERLAVEGMTCANCQRHIQNALLALPGVRAARVSFREGWAEAEYDPRETAPTALVSAIEEAGYTVRPPNPRRGWQNPPAWRGPPC